MLNAALYLIALLTAVLGFSGIAGAEVDTVMAVFHFSVIALVLSLLTRGFRRPVAFY